MPAVILLAKKSHMAKPNSGGRYKLLLQWEGPVSYMANIEMYNFNMVE